MTERYYGLNNQNVRRNNIDLMIHYRSAFVFEGVLAVWRDYKKINKDSKPELSNCFLNFPFVSDSSLYEIEGDAYNIPLAAIGFPSHDELKEESLFYKENYERIKCHIDMGKYIECSGFHEGPKIEFFLQGEGFIELHIPEENLSEIHSVYSKWLDEFMKEYIKDCNLIKNWVDKEFDKMYPDFLNNYEEYNFKENIREFGEYALANHIFK